MRHLVIALALVGCGHTQRVELSRWGTGLTTACDANIVIDQFYFDSERFVTVDDDRENTGQVIVLTETGTLIAKTSLEKGFAHGRGGGRLLDNPRAIVVVRFNDQNRRVCAERLSFE